MKIRKIFETTTYIFVVVFHLTVTTLCETDSAALVRIWKKEFQEVGKEDFRNSKANCIICKYIIIHIINQKKIYTVYI